MTPKQIDLIYSTAAKLRSVSLDLQSAYEAMAQFRAAGYMAGCLEELADCVCREACELEEIAKEQESKAMESAQ